VTDLSVDSSESALTDHCASQALHGDPEEDTHSQQAAEATIREQEQQEMASRTPPEAGQLALRALAKGEVLLLTVPSAAAHILLDVALVVMSALAPWPRALLPAAYPLWEPLLQLVDAEDRSVAAHAMRVVGAAAMAFGDELASRIVSNAISKLVRVLTRHAEVPCRAGVKALSSLLSSAPSTSATQYDDGSSYAASIGGETIREHLRGRSQEAVLAACRTLLALCSSARAMRPKVLHILRAAAPLLSISQAERVQEVALALCCRLSILDADTVWLFFVRVLSPPERWSATPPRGCEHPSTRKLLLCGHHPLVELEPNAKRVLNAVCQGDHRRAATCLTGGTLI